MSTRIPLLARVPALAVVAALLATGLALLGPAPAAHAANPVLVSPTGGQLVSGIPTLRWQRLTGTARYDLQLAADQGFTQRLVETSTVNPNFVPTSPLPANQELWWRVKASATGDTGWTTGSFRIGAFSAPTITSLAADPGSALAQPANPLTVSWSRVSGAQSYTVQISTQPGFNDAAQRSEATVRTTSWAPTDPQIADKQFYTRVRANFDGGLQSPWSAVQSYQIGALSDAVLISPTFQQTVTDVALDWKPVLGAVRYEVQVDANQSFGSGVIGATVVGTRWSPPNEFANRSYFWRVRGVDANGNAKDWSTVPVWQFTRGWDGQPQPEFPADNSVVGEPVQGSGERASRFYYQWRPSELTTQDEDLSLASSYLLQISTDATFQSILDQCSTTLTTYVPQGAGDCFPDARGSYYWRVIGQDDFSQIGNLTAATQATVFRFTYRPDQVQTLTPAHTSGGPVPRVTVPTLTWRPVNGSASYRVTVRSVTTGQVVVSRETPTTSFTPRDELAPGTYEWQVQTVSRDGRLGIDYISGWPRFEVESPAPATAPSLGGLNAPSGIRFPTLTWTPQSGAARYEVWAKPVAADLFQQVSGSSFYPAAEDLTDRFLTPGDYDWFVKSFNGAGGAIGQSALGRFTILPLETFASANVYAALSGSALPADSDVTVTSTSHCSTQLTAQGKCTNLRNTPVIEWPARPNVGFYKVYLAYDKAMTNGVYGKEAGAAAPVIVQQPMWTPPAALPDNQANTAYYLRIVSCSYGSACEKLTAADNAFDKLSRPVLLGTPRYGAVTGSETERGRLVPCTPTCANDVTLSWQDLRNSESTPFEPGTVTDRPFDSASPIQEPGRTEAMKYQVQVATDPGFQRLLDNAEVDQTTFTSSGVLYPEGQLHWRVRAVDANGNTLPWSAPGTFTKASPAPTLVAPLDGTIVSDETTLSWSALPYARSYHLEVYKNGDTTASSSNLVLDVVTRSRVWTLTEPLRASDGPYVWRVQPVDVVSNNGAWSEDWDELTRTGVPARGRFRVAAPQPGLVSPADAATDVAPSDTVFSWTAVTGAVNYRWELLNPAGTVREAVLTAALAWAPQGPVPGGSWRWRVTANDAVGNRLGSAERTFPVVDQITATTAPQLSGSGRVGEPITMTAPEWNLPNVTTTYQWLRNGADIGGQTGSTYVVTEADRGQQVSVRATGVRDGYLTGQSTSATIAGISGNAPVATTRTRISSASGGKVGTVITSTDPVWDNPAAISTYQWLRDGTAIGGATQATYTVTPDDVDKALTLKVTGKRPGYEDGTSVSDPVVGALGDAPVATTPVSITGPNRRTGTTWTLSGPIWGTGDVSTSYQWWRDGTAIAGATGGSYRLTDADVGTSVTVRATGTKRGYQPGVSVSNTVAVTPLDVLAPSAGPTVTGVVGVRETLTAEPGTWPGGATFSYQWFVGGEAVAKETNRSYVVRGRDAGKQVSVRVTATADGWASGSATSAPATVPLQKSSTAASTATPAITVKQRAVLNVKVELTDYGVDLGSVTVLDGKKQLAKVAVKSGTDGTLTIRLKKLKRGKHKLSVLYSGNAYTQPSKAKPVKIVVTKS